MTNRERALYILNYKAVDRLPAYWAELLTELAQQGKIPKELAGCIGDGRRLDELIGCDVPADAKWENIDAYFKKVNELYV